MPDTGTGAGPLLREWRIRRRRSQLDLAHEAGTSSRHLSFVETGRSTPGRALLLDLANRLDVPLRDRNAMLLAAGLAPEYRQTPFTDPTMSAVRSSVDRLLAAHDPYPGLVLDRHWNVLLANESAAALLAVLPEVHRHPPVNVFRASLAPDGLASLTVNFEEWSSYLLDQLHRLVGATGDPELVKLEREVLAYPNVAARTRRVGVETGDSAILIPFRLVIGEAELSLFSTLTSFGTPRDITLDELAVELFYPADAATEAALRA